MSTQTQSTTPFAPLLAAICTAILGLGGIAVIVLDLVEIARGRNIEDAPQLPLTLPLVCSGLLLLAIGWLLWLARNIGPRHITTAIIAAASVVLLVITPVFAWQAFTSHRQLTVISMTCDAEALRSTGGLAQANCQENAVDTIVLLEGVKSRDIWAPDESSGNLTRQFSNLPAGNWETLLTVDGPEGTVAVSLIGERADEDIRLGNFRPYMDSGSGRLRWSSIVHMEDDISTVRVQFFLSANPAVESASIRFDVMECRDQVIRTFDASLCKPAKASAAFVMEKTPTEPRTWRHPRVTREGTGIVITNLEARTYMLQPDYTGIENYTQSTDVLIIPTAMDQVEGNSVAVPGESVFEVPIKSNTGELTYTIYVFPAGPTFA